MERAQGPGRVVVVTAWTDADIVVHEAECIVGLEVLAIEALAGLTTEQLRRLRWVGLLDEGWTRMRAELARRGEAA